MTLYFYISVFILTALLLMPVSKIIWVSSVRRLEKKRAQPLSEAERKGQKNRALLIAVIIALPFSWLFNMHLLGSA